MGTYIVAAQYHDGEMPKGEDAMSDKEKELEQNEGEMPTENEEANAPGEMTESEQGEDQRQPTPDELTAELEKVRRELRRANRESASRRKRLEELEAAEEERKQTAMTDLDRAKQEAEDWKKKYEGLAGSLNALRRQTAFYEAVDGLGLAFANAQARKDAYVLADFSEVDVAEDGTVEGVEAVVKALQRSRPYLFSKPAGRNINASDTGGEKGPGIDEDEIKKAFGLR